MIEKVEPIIADPTRQAIDPQRGYGYQAWQSVYQWTTLKVDETLFLEGGEDIDVLKASEATTIQVKETAAVVTLNRNDVLEAIGHLWEHQENNPQRKIWFHFLTTSSRGLEKDKPFGEVKGLDHWDACKRDDVSLDSLRSFLKSKSQLPSKLLGCLNTATDDELREKLVRRILWDTDSESQSYLKMLIEGILIDYGTRVHSLPPSDSVKVVPHLFTRIWDVVCEDQDRRLNYSDFARLFEQVTSESVPSSELRQLRRIAQTVGQMGFGSLSGGSTVSSFALATADRVIIPPMGRLAERATLVGELRARLLVNGLLVLRGSTSTGKSTLGGLIVTLVENERWQRLDFRGLQPEFIRDRLAFVAASIDIDQTPAADYLIDDLNFEHTPNLYENALAAFIYVVRKRGGKIVITTQGELPTRIRLLFDLPEDCSYDVPLLTEDEIREVAQKYACPPGSKLDGWTKLIAANTGGHPLLVHAQIKNLQVAGWPKPTIEDLSAQKSVEDIRKEVRRRLQELLPSDAARTLAYRLSIFFGYFKKSNALYLGQYPSPIPNPGEAFDLLVGPWLERVSDNYYRLSPLLAGSADDMLPGGANELQQYAAVSYLKEKSWSQQELWGALFHGILGEAIPALVMAINASLQVETDDWPHVSRQLEFLCFMKVLPKEKLLRSDAFLSLLLRWLQFRIAAEVKPVEVAPTIAERWAEEVEEFDGKGAYPGSEIVAKFSFASLTLIKLNVALPMNRVVKNLAMTLSSLREGLEKQNGNPLLSQTFGHYAELWGDKTAYFAVAVTRCRTMEALSEFSLALASLSPEEGNEIWTKFGDDDHLAKLLVDSAWLSESKLESPNWKQCLTTFDEVARLAIEHRASSLAAAAYRGKAIVLREYLQDSPKAHQALDEGETKLGPKSLIMLQDYRAKIFSLDQDFKRAISIWNSIAPSLERNKNPSRIFTYRDAEIAAAGLDDWGSVSEFAVKAEEAARSASFNESLAIGFHADYAFALWMKGNRQLSTSVFVETLDKISRLGSIEDNLDAYTLRRKVSHAIAWMKQEIKGGDKVSQPPAAWFSDPGSTAEKTEEADPEENVWYHLAEIEYANMAGDTAFTRFEKAASKTPLQQAAVAKLRLGHMLRGQAVQASLVTELADFDTKLSAFGEAFGRTSPDWQSYSEMVQPFLLASLVVACSTGKYPTSSVIKEWGDSARRLKLASPTLENWLEGLEAWSQADESELALAMKNTEEKTETRILASLLLTAGEDTNPENLFYANVALLTTPNIFGVWSNDIEMFLAKLICEGWLRAVKDQRFALRSPNLTVPAIVGACDSDAEGFRKAAKVVVAARSAIQTKLDDSLLTKLTDMSETQVRSETAS
jgi:hypothetical protein